MDKKLALKKCKNVSITGDFSQVKNLTLKRCKEVKIVNVTHVNCHHHVTDNLWQINAPDTKSKKKKSGGKALFYSITNGIMKQN